MQPLVAIVRNPVTGFVEVVHPPMKLTELVGLLDMAKMQAYENYKHSGDVTIGSDGNLVERREFAPGVVGERRVH